MAYRLNPDFPALWRDPKTLQFGFDRARLIVDDLKPGIWYLLDALQRGVTLSGLRMLAKEHRLTDEELAHFLHRVSPVLHGVTEHDVDHQVEAPPQPIPLRKLRLEFTGEAELVQRFSRTLDQSHPARKNMTADLAIIGSYFTCFPAQWQKFAGQGRMHLPVIFGDQSVSIGPVIVPGITACLYCDYLWQEALEPKLATLASQTIGLIPSTTRGSLFWFALAELSRQLEHFAADGVPAEALSTRLFRDGKVLHQVWQRHPDCLCQGTEFQETAMVA